MRKLTTEEFIKKAKLVHGNKYDYSVVNYVKAHSKVTIICKIHGEFEQEAKSHYEGHNCPKCVEREKISSEEFIKKARLVHDNFYDYSSVKAEKNNKEKVIIICPIHGKFEQVIKSHLNGYGCKKCSNKLKELTTEEFIEKSKLIHGDKYDYSKVDYKGRTEKLKIICPIHGEFFQSSYNHLQGCGCLICSESKGEKEIAKLLTEMNVEFERQKKFEDCKNIYTLPFDFYIPSINTAIEFQGRQHYHSVEYFGGEASFIKQQTSDRIKKEYCLENNILLVEVRFDESVEEKLIPYLGKYEKIN